MNDVQWDRALLGFSIFFMLYVALQVIIGHML